MRKILKKKNIIIISVILMAFIFMTSPTLSKYRSQTMKRIASIITEYNVEYTTSGGKINEPEKFDSYRSAMGLTLPIEGEINRTGYDFTGWYDNSSLTGNLFTKIDQFETGDKNFYASWVVAKYDLTIQTKNKENITAGLPEGYNIVIGKDSSGNDNIVEFDNNGVATIGKNEIVSIRLPYSENVSSSGLSFSDENIALTVRYTDGDQYIYYDFTMPRKKITLTYDASEDTSSYIDISKSSIIFEKGVNIEGTSLTKNGFWYQSTISGMASIKTDDEKGNFYEWDYSKPFYVTSNNVETQNQLIVVDALNIYFKDCKLVPRDEYKTDFVGRKFKNYQLDILSVSQLLTKPDMADLSSYGNIVIKSTNDNVIKGLNLYIDGENTIGTIIQAYLRNSNNDEINIEGVNDGVLNLALLFHSASTLTINNITINEYENDFDYIMMLWIAKMSCFGTTLNASTKNIYIPDTMPYFRNYKSQRDSIIKLNNLRASHMVYLHNKTYMHIYNDLYTIAGFQMSENSSLLVDGNAFLGTGGAYHTGLNTDGYVLIKGSISGSDLILKKGTLIANTVGNSRGGANDMEISGGTLVTNLYSSIILPSVNLYSVNTDPTSSSLYATNSKTHQITANNDNLPFLMGEPTNTNAASVRNKTFIGGSIYVLGDYQTKTLGTEQIVDKSYHGQKVQDIINSLLEDNPGNNHPDIKESILNKTETSEKLNSDYLKQLVSESKTDKTSFVIGRSDIDWSIFFKGSELYIAGDMDLRFKTTITAGKIICYGNISSKHDLTIDGSNVEIETNEIGNQLALTQTTANHLTRYSTLSLKNGTMKANRIGAISKLVNSTPNRSTVILSGNASIAPRTGDTVTFVQDEYVNYLLSSMTNDSKNPTHVRYLGTVNLTELSPVNYNNITWSLLDDENNIASQDLSLINPKNTSNDGKWVLGSENGQVVTKFSTNGLLTNTEYAPHKEEIALYAVKSKYELQIKEGSNYISSITYPTGIENDELKYTTASSISNNDEYEVYTLGNTKKVTLELTDSSMKDKIIIWYHDGSGVLHNTMPEIAENGTTVTFNMPMAATEIYITNEITLFLDKYEIVLTDYGFRTTWEAPIGQENVLFDDTCFNYLGSVAIRQSTIKISDEDTLETAIYHVSATTGQVLTNSGGTAPVEGYITSNRIRFTSDFNNISESSRKVTIHPIYQKIVSDTNYCGIELLTGAQVHMYINGTVRTEYVENPTNSYLFMEGTDQTTSHKYSTGTTTTTMFGTKKGGDGGSYQFKNLTYHQTLPAMGIAGGKSLIFDNCILKIGTTYAIASSQNVEIINSTVTASYNLFSSTKTLDIKNSNVSAIRNAYPIFYGIKETVTLEGNTVVKEEMHPTPAYIGTNSQAAKIVIKDNASLSAKDIFVTKVVEIQDNGSLTVTGNGNLLLNSATVNGNNASITATDMILSGYYPTVSFPASPSTQLSSLSEFNNIASNYSNNKNMFVNGGILTLTNGIVNVSNQIGGNLDFELNVNGGTLNSKYIGTSNYLYGAVVNSYLTGEVYKYSRVSTSENHVMNINGGTVNVSEDGYLGGMNATVNINGGTVNLENSAIIGINETDTTTLVNNITSQGNIPSEIVDINITGGIITGTNGYINTPYSTLDIDSTTSNPSINIKDILASDGTVNIKGSSNHYDNPLGSGERVGTYLTGQLSAQNISITDGAVVYANDAISLTNSATSSGSFIIGENSYLYTNTYGTWGKGESILTNNGTVVGTRKYSIKYILNDTYDDPATNNNANGYISGTGLVLTTPTRYGYIFKEWRDRKNNSITEILPTLTGDKVLTAVWIPDTVEFTISIKASDVGLTSEELAKEVDLEKGTLVDDTFTYTEHLYIDYHAKYTDNNQLILSKYALNNYDALEVTLDNEILNPDNNIISLNSETITKTIMQYYKENGNTPLNIKITSLQKK